LDSIRIFVIRRPEELWCLLPIVARRRDLPFPGWNAKLQTTYENIPGRVDVSKASNPAAGWQGTQYTESENHPEWRPDKRGDFQGDVGGNFLSQKKIVTAGAGFTRRLTAVSSDPVGRRSIYLYDGPVLPCGPTNSLAPLPPYIKSGKTTLDAWGTRAIARCKPTNRVASALQACIEIYHEGLPKAIGSTLWKSQVHAAKRAGDEVLNYQFGLAPLAGDIASFAAGVVGMDQILAQYERDSGRVVRRRFEFPPEVSEDWSVLVEGTDAYVEGFNALYKTASQRSKGRIVRHRTTYVRRWFSGAFTYYIPARDRKDGTVKHTSLARKLLGIELTPELVWNVAPWSWAVDWVTSAGDVISNLTSWAQDGLVMRYGYIMEHSFVRDEIAFAGPTGLQSSDTLPPIVTLLAESKVRQAATPFGFGLLLSNFSTRQKAIMAALGLTKIFH
jgi:hypothetical protein